MAEYGLELQSEKTRLIQFGRFAAENRLRDGVGKPETFYFLGFTHICGTIWKSGKFTIHRKTVGKRMKAELKDISAKLHRRAHDPIAETGTWLAQVVRGYYNYHAVPENLRRLDAFRREIARYWLLKLRRRSQRTDGRGSVSRNWSINTCPRQPSYILVRSTGFAPNIQDKSRVRYVASGIMWRPACKRLREKGHWPPERHIRNP